MGHTVSLILVRMAGIVCACLLLFAAFGHAHAQPYDGYGLATQPASGDYTPAPGFSAAPANGGYSAAPSGAGYGYAPAAAFAPAPAALATPQPVNGMYAAPVGSSSLQPPAPSYGAAAPPAYVQPAPQPVQYAVAQPAPQSQAYGYKPGDGASMFPDGAAPAAAPGARYAADYVLGPRDKVRLTVYDETDLSGEYTIDGSGFVSLPLIGQVHAAGNTAAQLQAAVAGALAQGYLKTPRVAIEVSSYRPFYIIGAVNRPGEYPYVDHMSALNAVAMAGGYLPSASEGTLYVRHEGSSQEIEMPADQAPLIRPGDVVRVKNALFWDAMSVFSPLTSVAGAAAVATTIH